MCCPSLLQATSSVVLVLAGAQYTGGALNPARVIGPSLVFLCTPQKSFWAYLIGEVLGGILAAGACAATFGSAFSTSYLGARMPISFTLVGPGALQK